MPLQNYPELSPNITDQENTHWFGRPNDYGKDFKSLAKLIIQDLSIFTIVQMLPQLILGSKCPEITCMLHVKFSLST